MKLKTLIKIAVAVSLPVLLGACDRSSPSALDNAQAQLKETKAALQKTQAGLETTQAALEKAQASIEKMRTDMNDMHTERDSLKDQLEKTKTELAAKLEAYDQVRQQTGAIAKDLEAAKAQMAAVTSKQDQLQQQVQSLTKEKNTLIEMVVSASPADMPRVQEEIKKNPAAAKPLQNVALAAKLQEAESYLNAGNWQAAERVLLEIRAIDANYPGLDPLNSRIQNLKSRLDGQMQPPQLQPRM